MSDAILARLFLLNHSKSSGYKKLHQRPVGSYVVLNKHQILKDGTTNRKLQKFNGKFVSKVKPRSVRVKRIHEQHEIDLKDRKSMVVEYNDVTYRCAFSLLSIFLPFHWLTPLERKKQSCKETVITRPYGTWDTCKVTKWQWWWVPVAHIRFFARKIKLKWSKASRTTQKHKGKFNFSSWFAY